MRGSFQIGLFSLVLIHVSFDGFSSAHMLILFSVRCDDETSDDWLLVSFCIEAQSVFEREPFGYCNIAAIASRCGLAWMLVWHFLFLLFKVAQLWLSQRLLTLFGLLLHETASWIRISTIFLTLLAWHAKLFWFLSWNSGIEIHFLLLASLQFLTILLRIVCVFERRGAPSYFLLLPMLTKLYAAR